ncbi:MAG: hypothetical protein LKG56_07020 [Lachnospiraceae bacterium]|jgi:hypothetical protein|nr:hypothetical protein [Lachnospiraceae bacterium]MCH4069964.1 hypothetical protein [Lachnospiraceae bacterium]MCH4108683.1 hypothetical protein [Lachnospiraceae bacterium]MCI1302834.1 hypothetical protein [Lachnospiraceae bacterium]MCI1332029.1 hypothetical protein [Lachnospiraceae bacterium]
MKRIIAGLLTTATIMASCISVSANELVFYHGNDDSAKKCFAATTQTEDENIGARITWQLSDENTVEYGPYNTSNGYQVTSYSRRLAGKSGWSYGYYYNNGTIVHRSTEWYGFNF